MKSAKEGPSLSFLLKPDGALSSTGVPHVFEAAAVLAVLQQALDIGGVHVGCVTLKSCARDGSRPTTARAHRGMLSMALLFPQSNRNHETVNSRYFQNTNSQRKCIDLPTLKQSVSHASYDKDGQHSTSNLTRRERWSTGITPWTWYQALRKNTNRVSNTVML
eukprot:scpid40245/ scgid26971/ 